jgi:adenylate cyclase class IV
MRNLEWKCELLDADLARSLLQRCGAAWIETIDLRDTHYRLAEGRLLRRHADFRPVQWFRYARPTQLTPAISEIEVFSDAQATLRFGAIPPPVFAQVEMRREMWLSGRVRINIDQVAWLGPFIELEARLSPSITPRIAAAMLRGVRRCVAPALGEPIAHAYSELVQRRAAMCLTPDDEIALETLFVNPNHARPA